MLIRYTFTLLIIVVANTCLWAQALPAAECVKPSMIANSDRLEKARPMRLSVTVTNLCGRAIEINEPSLTLDRSEIGKQVISGDRRVGRVFKNSKLDNSVRQIAAGQQLVFEMRSNEVRWMDSISSIDVFQDLFTHRKLKPGSYQLYSEIVVYPSTKQHYKKSDGDLTIILSNKIEVTFGK